MEFLSTIHHSRREKTYTTKMTSKAETLEHKARILVILEPHLEITRLFRVAKRKALQQNLDWEVVLIETPALQQRLGMAEQEGLLGAITLAEQMGALVTRWRSPKMLTGIHEILAEYKGRGIEVSALVAAQIHQPRSWFRFGKPLIEQISSTFSQQLSIISVPLSPDPTLRNQWARLLNVNYEDVLIALFTVLLATSVIELIEYTVPEAIGSHNRNKSIIYMIACAFCATRYGLLAGITAAISSYAALNLFYVTPNYDLIINDMSDAVNVGLFLLGGIILSFIGSHGYGNSMMFSKRADRFHSLLKVHRLALNKTSPGEAIAALDNELRILLGADIVFYMPAMLDETRLEMVVPKDIVLNESEQKALQICWEESKTTGVGAPYRPDDCQWRFEPLTTAQDEIGVFGIRVTEAMVMDADFGRLISGIADQVALILERLHLGQMAEDSKIQAEREKLRAMLLSSVSHDLKTPLASIIGSLSVYRSMGNRLPEEQRHILISTAIDEAQRLDSFISNILDMTRIESGQIELREEWTDPNQMISEVRRRLRERLRHHTIVVNAPPNPIEVAMDPVMTAQVMQNLLDNAAKYTAHGTTIEITWRADTSGFTLEVHDHGAGIPADQLEKIFDKYTRINRQDHQVAGTGLGLAIARAVMQAQGGTVTASNHPNGGGVFTLTLPKTRTPDEQKAA
jgi:two-component system sensor histidine kinase KdpD